MKQTKIYLLFLLLITLFASCKKTEIEPNEEYEEYKDMPEEVGYYLGNQKSNLVLVNAQGGPVIDLFKKEFEDIL